MRAMRILVLVDFSLYTRNLIKVASNWADLFNAELVLVHEVPGLVPALADYHTRYKIIDYEMEEAFSQLKTLAESKIPEHISTKYEVTDRRLENFLPQLIPDDKETLIMLGLKGTGLLKKVFIGSVATQIINELDKITVGVPLKATQAAPENLIIPVYPKHALNEVKLDQLVALLAPFVKNIDFVSITESNNKDHLLTTYQKGLESRYDGNITSSHKIFRGNKIFEEFKLYTSQQANSFLVLQKGGRSLKDLVLKRFFINKVVHEGSIPLIVLPE